MKTYNRYVILAIIAISGFTIGTESASVNEWLTQEVFLNYYGEKLLKRELTMLAASNAIGAVCTYNYLQYIYIFTNFKVGSVIFGTFCDYFGCVLSFQVANGLWILGSIVAVILEFMYVLIIGRIIKGVSIGFVTSLIPVYVSEIFPPNRKGSAISLFHMSIVLGTITTFFVGRLLQHTVSYLPFKITWAIEGVPALLMLILTIILPELPKWLASKSRWIQAAKSLNRVRSLKRASNDESDRGYVTRAYTASNRIVFRSYSDLFKKKMLKFTIIGVLLHVFVQLSCVSIITYFYNYVCIMCGLDEETQFICVAAHHIIVGMLTILPVLVLDSARRVDHLCYGMFALGATFIGIFATLIRYSIETETDPGNSPFDFVVEGEAASAILALFLFLSSAYASCVSSVTWLYTGELFGDASRSKGTALCMCVGWIVNGIMSFVLPTSLKLIQGYVFLVLGVCCLLGSIIFLRFPETKSTDELIPLPLPLPNLIVSQISGGSHNTNPAIGSGNPSTSPINVVASGENRESLAPMTLIKTNDTGVSFPQPYISPVKSDSLEDVINAYQPDFAATSHITQNSVIDPPRPLNRAPAPRQSSFNPSYITNSNETFFSDDWEDTGNGAHLNAGQPQHAPIQEEVTQENSDLSSTSEVSDDWIVHNIDRKKSVISKSLISGRFFRGGFPS